jgi:hypothetical protein
MESKYVVPVVKTKARARGSVTFALVAPLRARAFSLELGYPVKHSVVSVSEADRGGKPYGKSLRRRS